MITTDSKKRAASASAVAVASLTTAAATSVSQLVEGLKSSNNAARADAIKMAAEVGPEAIPSLCDLLQDPDIEVTRAARRALNNIVHSAGSPGARQEARAAEAALVEELDGNTHPEVRRETLTLLSEIGRNACVPSVTALLSDPQWREDARLTLQRIPGRRSLRALERAYRSAPDDFRNALADSLVRRGVEVPDYQSDKLKPVKATKVKPGGEVG